MAVKITPFDLIDPLTAIHMDTDRCELIAIFNAWAAVRAIRPSHERLAYYAEQKQLRASYRVWIEGRHPLENHHLIKWRGRFFELASEPVQDSENPWMYFVMQEVRYDLSNYLET